MAKRIVGTGAGAGIGRTPFRSGGRRDLSFIHDRRCLGDTAFLETWGYIRM